MRKTNDSAVPEPDVFDRSDVVADAVSVVTVREELERWLKRGFELDALRLNDLVLAVNEALANVAEFAYRHASQPGTVDIRAEHDRSTSILTITVTDRGSWRDDSELARLNAAENHIASPDLYAVVAAAEGWRSRSRGAFDGRLGQVEALWRAGEVSLNDELTAAQWMTPAEIASLTATTDGLAEMVIQADKLI